MTVCHLSIGSGHPTVCHGKECSLWNESSKPPGCLDAHRKGWQAHYYFLMCQEMGCEDHDDEEKCSLPGGSKVGVSYG